jgi:hypothetical protein
MPELRDLEAKLAALRREVAQGTHAGYTPTEILKLRRECHHLWAAIEELKLGCSPLLRAADAAAGPQRA